MSPKRKLKEIKFTQITTGTYNNQYGNGMILYALGEDGRVYKDTKDGWFVVHTNPGTWVKNDETAPSDT